MPIPGAPPLLAPLDRALQKWAQVPVGEPELFTGLVRTIQHNSISNITSNFGTGNYVTTAFTPPNSSLLVAVCGAVEAAGNPPFGGDFAIAGGGLTWTLQKSQLTTGTFTTGVFIYTAPVTTGSSMQVTLSCNARDMGFYAITVLSYTGYNTGSPVGATGSDFLDAGIPGPPTPTSFNLNANPALTSEIVAGVSMDKNRADVTPGVGWQEISDYENTSWGGMQVQVINNYGSTIVSWVDLRPTDNGSGALFNWADAAIEIKVASAAPDQNLALGGIPTGEAVGLPTVTTTYTINASGITSSERLGASPLTTTVTVAVNGIASSESVGNASVAQSVSASGIPTEQRVGSPTVSATYTMTPQGIISSESVGNPSVATASSVLPNGISSEQQLGSPAVTATYTINAGGITTSERLGASSLSLTVPASGIGSAERLGNPSVTVITAINAGNIASSEQLGSPSITATVTINAGGIASGERFGALNIAAAVIINAGGIASSERLGASQVQPGAVTINAFGAVSDSQVGFTQVSLGPLGLTINAGGIPSMQRVGFPHTGQQVVIDVVHVAIIPITVWRETPVAVVIDDDDDDIIAVTGEDDVEHINEDGDEDEG